MNNETEKRLWWLTRDGDKMCLDLFSRHYSARQYEKDQSRKLFCGPGQKIVLRTLQADAMFVWRKFIDDSGQNGVNCAVFRNESPALSSELIRQADLIAEFIWPNERHYTFVNQDKIRSTNPGACFKAAGWKTCGVTQKGLLILEKLSVQVEYSIFEKWNSMVDRNSIPSVNDGKALSDRLENILFLAGYIQGRYPDTLRKLEGYVVCESDYGFSDKDFI